MLKFIAVDDERPALEYLVSLVKSCVADAQIQGFTDVEKALDSISRESPDVIFLDISMPGINGLEAAKRCKTICPNANVIFVTGYSEFAIQAFRLRASGYLLKPVCEENLIEELKHLRKPPAQLPGCRIKIQTFGNFECFVDGVPLNFSRSKCKECLAYLVDRRGAGVTTGEICAVLFEERADEGKLKSYTRTIIAELLKSLSLAGISNLIVKNHNRIFLNVSIVDCDFFRMLSGDNAILNTFRGEYMANYSWAEMTLGGL